MMIKLMTEGGAMKPGPSLSQKLGPAGINVGQVISKVNEATGKFKGMKVPVELSINPTTKEISVHVLSPPTAGLLKQELHIETGSGDHKKVTVANASIEQIIAVAKNKQQNMLAKDLKAAVKMVVGSCVSLGIFVESKQAKEMMDDIDAGIYDTEIKQGKTDTDTEKRKKLDEYLVTLKAQQEKILKQEAAAKEAEAAAKSAAAAATPATPTAAGAPATPAATTPAAATPAAKTAAPKEEAKKKK